MDWRDLAGLAGAYGVSYLSQWTDGVPRPFSASLAVTNRCNIHCSYCNCPSLDPSELSVPEISIVLDRLRAMGVRRIGLVGGEPLVRRDFGEIVAAAKRRGLYVTLNSNLMLYQRNVESVNSADLVFTSLDGDEQTHRNNRGANSLTGVLEAVSDLCQRGKKVVAICVLTSQNLDQTSYLLDLAEKIGFQMHFQAQCLDSELVRPGAQVFPDSSRLRAVWKNLIGEKKRGRRLASSLPYLEVLSRWEDFATPAYADASARCAAGRAFLYVDAAGRAYPCPFTKGKTAGVDLLKQNWQETFKGETPCTRCLIGPMLEMNLLFERPLAAALNAARHYAG
jgi:MoaA/NifB/PqqE/SkfB family radical SAM enzyme